MPATATARQVSFLQTLVSERDLSGSLAAEAASVLAHGEGAPIARDLIDRVVAVPRRAADMPAPSQAIRAGRMLAAGSIEATVTLADGQHVTVQIRTRRRQGRGWTNAHLGEDGSRTTVYVLGRRAGWINLHGDEYRLTLRTRDHQVVLAIDGLLAYCAGRLLSVDGVERVQEASRCGRCFRRLTDPVSIDRGIGPECFGRGTGSRHVTIRDDGEPVEPTPAYRTQGLVEEALAAAGTTAADVNAVARRRARRRARIEREQAAFNEAEARMHAMVAEREREQETAAFLSDPDNRIPVAAEARAQRRGRSDEQRARDLIAEALDAYCTDDDAAFAIGVFDRLATQH